MQANGINEAMVSAPKSGTAWRQTEAALQEAHSLFELMTENKGLAIEDMLRKFVIPHLKKKMDTSDEISNILTEQQIKKIDSLFIPNEAKRRVNRQNVENVLNGKPTVGGIEKDEAIAGEEETIGKDLEAMGSQRFIKPSEIDDKTQKQVLEDVEWEVDVDVTGEGKDTQAMMATLTTVFQTVASLQGQPMPPDMKTLFNKILELSQLG